MLYGRSLSFCVADIISGAVNENDVAKIVTSTRVKNKKDFIKCVEFYKNIYWTDNPELGESIAFRLWDSGKIIQPRLKNKNFSQKLYMYPRWANSLEEAMESIDK